MKHIIFFFVLYAYIFRVHAHGTLVVSGVKHEEGFLDIKVYLNKENFLKEEFADESIRKKPTKEETVIPLSKIHEGIIAIAVYHDENGNGKLDTGLFWRPKEGFAFSNNYIPKGPPKFKKAAFQLIHGEPVVIKLKY